MDDKIYRTGTIYKLYSHINEYYYIGSCNGTLRDRYYQHKCKEGRYTSKKVSDWIDDIGLEELKIIEMKTLKDVTKKETLIAENEMIKEDLGKEFCLNCRRAYRDNEEYKLEKKDYDKEYRMNNLQTLKIKSKKKHIKNRDRNNNRSSEWYGNNKSKIYESMICKICNVSYTKLHYDRHCNCITHIINFIHY